MSYRCHGKGIVATVCLTAVLNATQEVLEFEFVSLRRSPRPPSTQLGVRGSPGEFLVLPDGRLEVRGKTLADLAGVAFGFDVDSTRGVSVVRATADWMLQDRFDITATAGQPWTTASPALAIPPELRTMLRALLEDRFSMQTRIATKKVDVIALSMAKPEQLGPYLRPSTGECREPVAAPSPDEATTTRRCQVTITQSDILAEGVTMPEVAHIIARHGMFAGRLYVDQTGLPGRYDMSFSITRQRARTAEGMFEEQLGLRLRPTSIPLPSLIIERAKKPQLD